MSLQAFANGSAIVIFGGGTGSPPDPFLPPPTPLDPENQPTLDAQQGFSPIVGFSVLYTGPMIPQLGVSADERTQ